MIIGYFLDEGVTRADAKAKDAFVVFENGNDDKIWLELYCPVGQHSELKDDSYLDVCETITKDEYKQITKGFHTPGEYL